MVSNSNAHVNADGTMQGRDVAGAWQARSEELAAWAWPFVNRTDVWGGYLPLDRRGQKFKGADGKETVYDGPVTRPATKKRGQVLLTKDIIAQHFAGARPEDVVGLHALSRENTARWGGADIDKHDKGEAD